ncbi:MAG: acetyl-CoA carboxylase carboxyl transferase subunit beta, partial [Bacteroidota bacterium]
MSWFKRKKAGILTDRRDQNEAPAGQWIKCPKCGEILNRREYQDNKRVCPKCQHHFSMDSLGYFDMLFDDGQYELHDTELLADDPLGFTDRKPYSQRLESAQASTGLNDAARAATGRIGGHD